MKNKIKQVTNGVKIVEMSLNDNWNKTCTVYWLERFQMTVESKNVIALYLILVGFLIGSKTGELMVLV